MPGASWIAIGRQLLQLRNPTVAETGERERQVDSNKKKMCFEYRIMAAMGVTTALSLSEISREKLQERM